jgi:ferritin-like protein
MNLPTYPFHMEFQNRGFVDRAFDIHLGRFCPAALQTFLAIEKPRTPKFAVQELVVDHIVIPEPTIGEFYDEIVALFDGQVAASTTDPNAQVTWSATGNGWHLMTVVGVNADGSTVESDYVAIGVYNTGSGG